MNHTHIIIKEARLPGHRDNANISQFSKVDEASGVVDLVSEISKGDSVKVKAILRIDSDGYVVPMDIVYKDGRLQLAVK